MLNPPHHYRSHDMYIQPVHPVEYQTVRNQRNTWHSPKTYFAYNSLDLKIDLAGWTRRSTDHNNTYHFRPFSSWNCHSIPLQNYFLCLWEAYIQGYREYCLKVRSLLFFALLSYRRKHLPGKWMILHPYSNLNTIHRIWSDACLNYYLLSQSCLMVLRVRHGHPVPLLLNAWCFLWYFSGRYGYNPFLHYSGNRLVCCSHSLYNHRCWTLCRWADLSKWPRMRL